MVLYTKQTLCHVQHDPDVTGLEPAEPGQDDGVAVARHAEAGSVGLPDWGVVL